MFLSYSSDVTNHNYLRPASNGFVFSIGTWRLEEKKEKSALLQVYVNFALEVGQACHFLMLRYACNVLCERRKLYWRNKGAVRPGRHRPPCYAGGRHFWISFM